MKKVLAVLLAAIMSVGALGGCAGKEGKEEGKVVLKYLMTGPGMQVDSDRVWAEWNKKLQEKLPNVEVKFEIIPITEFQQNFALMLSAKEQMDIVSTYGLDFATEARRGVFAPLDELLDEYGKDILENIPDWYMNYQKIDGVTYGVPGYQGAGSNPALFMFKEVAEKYLDIEGFTKEFQSNNNATEKAYDYLEQMLENAKADGYTFKTTQRLWTKGTENINSEYVISMDPDDEVKVEYLKLSDETRRDYERRREWYEKGFVREDSLGATDDGNYIGKLDGMPWWSGTYSPEYEKVLTEKYGHEVIAIPYYNGYYIPSTNSAAGTSIISTCEHKEEAMQVINLLQSDKELFNMLLYGIEGEHYTKIGEDRIETPTGAQASSSDKYGLWDFILGNVSLAYDMQTTREGNKEWIFGEVNQSEWKSKLLGFCPDTSKFATELTQVKTLATEYEDSLNSGALANWEEMYNEWKQKFELAGGLKIQEELQRQIDEFLASKN